MDSLKFLYKIPDRFEYKDYNSKNNNNYNYYIIFESIQFINREKSNSYGVSGSICIGTPLLFFRTAKRNYSSEEGEVEIIKKDSIEFRYDSWSEIKYNMDQIYDFSISDLTIFRPDKFKFPKKENREYKLGEILKTEIN